MYTCTKRDRTKSLGIRGGYKGTKSIGREGDLIWSDTGRERKEDAASNE